MKNRTEHLIMWFDMEATGDSDQDIPLEIAAVLTDWDLNYVSRYHSLVQIPEDFNLDYVLPVVREMHSVNGLWGELASAHNHDLSTFAPEVDNEFLGWLAHATNRYDEQTDGKVLETLNVRLAGSGVSHYDSRMIKRHFPLAWSQITGFSNDTKPTLDLGVIRRFLQTMGLDYLVAPNEFDTLPNHRAHRAMDDVILFIEQARWYRRMLKQISQYTDLTRYSDGELRVKVDDEGNSND